MRIWIVSEGEPLPSDGENVRLRRMGMLSLIMSQAGHDVHWFSSTFHHYTKKHRSEDDTNIQINKNLTIHLIKTKGYKKNVSLQRVIHHRKISKWMKTRSNFINKPDIILATLAPLELSSTMIKYARENSIPIVVDIRDLWPEIYYEVVPSWAKGLMQPYVYFNEIKMKRALNNTTSIIGVTPKFLQYGIDLAKMKKRDLDRVFYTSYKPQKFSEELSFFDDEWKGFKLNKEDFIVTFLGNFGKQFEFEPVIIAANLLKDNPNIKFVLCGLGEAYESIADTTKELGNVILPGWIEKNKINSLLAASDVGLAPYRNSRNFRDNTPNKFGEYLSASIPVILGIEGIMSELLKQYNAGLSYKDGEELSLILKKLSENKKETEVMSRNAYELFNEKFNANNVYTELSNFLCSIAEDNE